MKKYFIFLFLILLFFSGYFLYENYTNKDIKKNKIVNNENIKAVLISEKNAEFISLNNRKSSIPFHPVKISKFNNEIYYIDYGKLYKYNLNTKNIIEIKIPYISQEIINMTVFKNNIYILDKLNIIYVYDILKNKFVQRYNFNDKRLNSIEPQFIGINSQNLENKLYILDNSQNIIFNLSNNILRPYNISKKIDFTNGVDFYYEKNNFYILNRGNIFKKISGNYIQDKNISEQHDLYNYLKIYSNKDLKNIYLSGGYNGDIKAISKYDNTVKGNYFVKYKNKELPVFDLFIDKNSMYIIADNFLIINKRFIENKFDNLKNNFDNDMLEENIKTLKLTDIKLPLNNGSSLPLHASVYPGARRLYRTGIHEGIDLFEGVTINTPVIACKKGIVLRIDKNYKEISPKYHNEILNKCKKLGYTPPDIADLLRGRQVVIKHDNNLISVYSHLSSVNNNIEIKEEINEGDILGYIGNSGTTDGVNKTGKGLHLHFELHVNDKTKKLEYYLGKYLSVEETMQIYQKIIN